jgi:tripartite-type tricarboxylate transporter receptor subunit TctC
MRRVIAAGLLTALLTAPLFANAQGWPAKPIRTVITVGGGMEQVARIVGQGLSQSLGQPVIVEAQSGAGGLIGQEAVARAAPDGYTLMMSVASTHISPGFMSKQARFDPLKSYTPIAKVAESVLLVAVNAELPVSNIAQLREYAKRNPGKLSYGTIGVGSGQHMSAVTISQLTGLDWVHVPYKNGTAVMTDTMTGQLQAGWAILATIAPFMKSGKLRVIGINGSKRYSGLPDVPTLTEQVPGYEPPPTWAAYFGPAGLPQPITSRLHAELLRVVALPDTRKAIEATGSTIATSSPEELAEIIRRDMVSVAKAAEVAGVKPE